MIYLLHAFPPFPPLLSIDLVIEKTMHRDDSTRILPPPRLKGSYLSFAENQNPCLFCRHGYDPGDDHFDVRLSLRFVHKSCDPLALRTLISPLQRSPFLSHLMTPNRAKETRLTHKTLPSRPHLALSEMLPKPSKPDLLHPHPHPNITIEYFYHIFNSDIHINVHHVYTCFFSQYAQTGMVKCL